MTLFQFHGESDEHFAARRALTERGLTYRDAGNGRFFVDATEPRNVKPFMTGAEVLAWLEGQR
jgi:hypothetical protein